MAKPSEAKKFDVDIVTLSNATILDQYGQPVRTARLWQQGTAVLIFLRHFACIACRAHAVQVWGNRAQFEKSGGRVYFIGNGQPEYIAHFKSELKLEDAPVFTDPTLKTFRAAGFKHGFLAAWGPSSIKNAITLASDGHRQGPIDSRTGSQWQLGGVLVILPTGRVTYQFISLALGDFPPEQDVIAAEKNPSSVAGAGD